MTEDEHWTFENSEKQPLPLSIQGWKHKKALTKQMTVKMMNTTFSLFYSLSFMRTNE